MIELFFLQNNSQNDKNSVQKEIKKAFWVNVIAPTPVEISDISKIFDLDENNIKSAIDPEEKIRLESHKNYTFLLFDIPIKKLHRKKFLYKTIPLGIICTSGNVITICAENSLILDKFKSPNRIAPTIQPFNFICLVLLESLAHYQNALLSIDKKRIEFEERIENIREEEDIIDLHSFESTLVYFTTSLQGNHNVLLKLAKIKNFSSISDGEDILNDVIVENQQAIEMTQIYREIIDGTRELISSIINLRLNRVMKRLTSITLILSIPMAISGMYGMNVDTKWMPFSQTVHGFGIIWLIILVICLILGVILKKKNML